jgi:transposase InsO family protein
VKQVWEKWKNALVVVKPETVIRWERNRFRKYWKKISKNDIGRKPVSMEIRDLIKRMASENNWGAGKIFSELLKLGFSEEEISEPTVSRYLRKFRKDDPDGKKAQSWKTFLKNHRDVIAGMDFFTVPTIRFRLLYVFFVIDHGRRKILHFNVTENPYSSWVIQQLRETFGFDYLTKYMILDRDGKFSDSVKSHLKHSGIEPIVTSYRSPWQNGIAERFVKSIRDELLNHVIVFSEAHLKRMMKEYVTFYNKDRCHQACDRDSPEGRAISRKSGKNSKLIALPKLGGLQHVYKWEDAA